LNLVSFFVFMDKEFEMALYSYMRVYTINSAVVCLLVGTFFTANTYSFFNWTFTYPAQFYYIYIFIPFGSTSYYYGTMLDIFITLDRISNFHKSITKLFITGPYKICAVVLAFCFITNAAFYFDITTGSMVVSVKNSSHILTVWFNYPSAFSYTQLGTVLTVMLECWRDAFLTLAEIALNCVSIQCLRQYFKKRAVLINGPTSVKTTHGPKTHEGKSMEGSNNSNLPTVSYQVAKNNVTTNTVQKKKTTTAVQNASGMSNADMRATIMTIMMCALSVLEHISMLSCVVYPYFGTSLLNIDFFCFGGNIGQAVKHSANFFIFYFFNKKFAEKLHAMFKFKK
jgi:hypothetical protein